MLQSLLAALTGRSTVPNILLNYTPLGGADTIELLHSEGSLSSTLNRAGLRAFNNYGRRAAAGQRAGVGKRVGVL